MVRESRHLWVGNLPENLRDDQIVEYFSRFGRVEKVKILPKKNPDGGLAAFVDFVDIRSATKANETTNYMGERELRTNYNEPGNHPSLIGEGGRGRGRAHLYDRGRGTYPRRDRPALAYSDEDGGRRGRFPYSESRPGYSSKRPRIRRDSPPDSPDSDRPSSPKYTRNRTGSVSSQSERGRSSSPDNDSYSGSDAEVRGKSVSPARSNGSSQSQKNTSIQIKNLSTRPGDNSIKDALFHEFKKVGEIVNIRIVGSEKERYALVKFRRSEDAEKSLQSNSKTFLGNEMKISVFKGENKDKEGEANFSLYRKKYRSKEFAPEDVPFDPHATRTLFVGNLDKMLTHGELRKMFEKFGDVVDVDIKKQNPGVTTYAFLQYVDINGAMRAKHRMDREIIRGNRIKVGFGRGTPTNTIWIGNVAQNSTEGQMQRQFHPFGYVARVIIDRECWQGLVSFDTIDAATYAFENMRGRYVLGRKLLVDFASRSCKEGFYTRMERTGQLDRRTLEPSPPPTRGGNGMSSGFAHGGYSGRGRGFRGGFNKGFGYTGRFSQTSERAGHGEFREFSQGSQEYYPESYFPEEDYDDYEKELRDYGYRQRERERESGKRPERDSSRNRDREYPSRERPRERKRAYTPLSDDDQVRSVEHKSEDDDDDYSEKDIQSKIVKPGLREKRKRSEDESMGGDSPDAVEEADQKVDKKEKKKKKERKEKSNKKKSLSKSTVDVEKEMILEDEELSEDKKLGKPVDVKSLKAEKRKKRKLSEKGLAAEEKARRKELRKLKKLKKLQAELGRSDDLPAKFLPEGTEDAKVEDAEFPLRKDVERVEGREKTPPTPGLEEDLAHVDAVIAKAGTEEDGAVKKEDVDISEKVGEGGPSESDSEKEKMEELERKRDELRRLEEEEKIKSKKDVEKDTDRQDGVDSEMVVLPREDVKTEAVEEKIGEDVKTKQPAVSEAVNSDSDQSELVIVEAATTEPPAVVETSDVKTELSKKETDGVARTDQTDDKVREVKAAGVTVEKTEEDKHVEPLSQEDKKVVPLDDAGDEQQKEAVVKDEATAKTTDKEDSSEKKDSAEKTAEVLPTKETDDSKKAAMKVEIANQDIYSSESDSSDDLDDVDLPDDDDDDDSSKTGSGRMLGEGAENPRGGDKLETPLSPDRTPPTPDLEEDSLNLKERLQYPSYGIYSKDYPTDGKGASPLESDEEKVELERSMKEANFEKRKNVFGMPSSDRDKKRNRKERIRSRKVSTSSEHDSDSAKSGTGQKARSPSDDKPKADNKPRRTSPQKRSTLDRVEAIERSLKVSPRDSPDWRERKESFPKRDPPDSPRKREGRRKTSIEAVHRGKSPEFRRSSPDRRDMIAERVRREPFGNRGSPDRSLSPRRRHSIERRQGIQRGRDIKGRRDDEYRGDERDMKGIREPIDIREPRDIRDNRDMMRDRDTRDTRDIHHMKDVRDMREGRDFRDSRDARDVRGGDKTFRPVQNEPLREKDRLQRDRIYNRDRDMVGRGGLRGDIPDRGMDRGDHRGRGGFKEGFREADRPQRHTPPVPPEQRSRSPARYPGSSGDRIPRTAESRAEGIRPRTPEQSRPRSPMMRMGERRRGRSTERRASPPPPRVHERESDYHRKDSERAAYRDQADRREREREKERRDKGKEETPPPPPPPPEPRKEQRSLDPGMHQQQTPVQQRPSSAAHIDSPSGTPGSMVTPNPPVLGSTSTPVHFTPPPPPPPTNADSLLDLLRRYPVMWQGLFALKNDSAAVQMHYISGNVRLAEASLPRSVQVGEVPPPLRISQRMKLELSQLEGVNKRIKNSNEHCMLLALPCGRDPLDVHAQTRALKTGFITYLQVKQAAGIINIVNSATKQPAYVLHIFPPCEFAEVHLARVAPDLLDSAADSGHLMVLITPV